MIAQSLGSKSRQCSKKPTVHGQNTILVQMNFHVFFISFFFKIKAIPTPIDNKIVIKILTNIKINCSICVSRFRGRLVKNQDSLKFVLMSKYLYF